MLLCIILFTTFVYLGRPSSLDSLCNVCGLSDINHSNSTREGSSRKLCIFDKIAQDLQYQVGVQLFLHYLNI